MRRRDSETMPRPALRRRAATVPALLALALLAASLLVATPVAAQDDGQRVGEVVWVRGTLTGQPSGGNAAPLADLDPVFLDMRLRTGEDSGAALTFDPRGQLRLGANADVTLDRARLDESGASDGAITVFLGYVRASLSSLFRGTFTADTPAATIGVKGTVFGVRVVEDGETTVWAFEALGDDLTVTSRDTGESVVLESGYVTVVARGAAPTTPVPFDPKTGAAEGLVLPLPPEPGPGFEEPPLPDDRENLPPDRGNDRPNTIFGGKPGDG
jgi:hypothetical protein